MFGWLLPALCVLFGWFIYISIVIVYLFVVFVWLVTCVLILNFHHGVFCWWQPAVCFVWLVWPIVFLLLLCFELTTAAGVDKQLCVLFGLLFVVFHHCVFAGAS